MADEIQQFTEQLSEALDFKEDLQPDDNKIYTLRVSADLVIQYADLNPGLNLMSYLEPLPEENKETFLMTLMRVNLFGKGTGGGVLGYDEESRLLTFMQAIPYTLTYTNFKESIEDFINYVELWKEELHKLKDGKTSLLTI